jgi:hypothetical protein
MDKIDVAFALSASAVALDFVKQAEKTPEFVEWANRRGYWTNQMTPDRLDDAQETILDLSKELIGQ